MNDFVAAETVPPGELDEFPGPGQYRAALRRTHHGDTAAAPELEQALFPEQVKRTQDGVLVHPEHRREVLGQRQALAGTGLTVRDGPPDLRRNLVVEGERGRTIDSADGRYLLMSQTATSLTQTPVTGGTPRTLTLPPGWYLPGGDGLADVYSGAGVATANGILVQSGQSPGPGGTVIGLWNPVGHRVTVIGRAQAVIGAHTPPGAGDTQLAWIPAGCGDCPVRITDTATMAVRSVRSPLGHGFARGGAFSPDGTTLALFARLDNRDAARLMLVDLATGSARVAREPQLAVGAGIGWAQWVPDGRRLVMGPASTGGGYLVDTVTLSARPLTVIRGNGRDPTSSQDPNYTTVLIPPPR